MAVCKCVCLQVHVCESASVCLSVCASVSIQLLVSLVECYLCVCC